MTVADAVVKTPSVRGLAGTRWWLWLSLTAIVLLLAAAAAIGITNRDPDLLFMHFWWTPIAQAPTLALLIGSIGLDLLVTTGIVAFVHRLIQKRRPVRPPGPISFRGRNLGTRRFGMVNRRGGPLRRLQHECRSSARCQQHRHDADEQSSE
jgi:hypothetical protein